ncbi:hypothetical protein AeMF1_001413 [Aphanomyces euteiches]|nr:hypothetical protein AeMF1_001413 [Aphanomyces euteiches]KAH9131430.1 hypothetical protein AeNC1_019647 [Aphanomyces euteiches]
MAAAPSPLASSTSTSSLAEHESKRKRLEFTTATIYVFEIDHGGSALPAETGPPVGLARRHTHLEHIDLKAHTKASRASRRVRKYNHHERMDLLKAANYSMKEIADFCFEAIDIRKSRLATLDEIEARRQERRRKRLQARRALLEHQDNRDTR